MKIKGSAAMHTRVMSHPLENAMLNPAMNIEMVIKRVDTFYPIAPETQTNQSRILLPAKIG